MNEAKNPDFRPDPRQLIRDLSPKEAALRWIALHPRWLDSPLTCEEPIDVRPGKTQDCDSCAVCFSRIARQALELESA